MAPWPSHARCGRLLIGGLLALAACSGPGVEAPATTVIDSDGDQLTQAVLPEVVAAPVAENTVDTDPATFYVSPVSGNDANDGQTAERPVASLQEALDRLEPGQTLFLLSGRYDELAEPGNAHYTIDVDGAPDRWIRVQAAPGAEPEIVAGDGNGLEVRRLHRGDAANG
ncbi:MAG: hypothetical protein AAFN30_20190, partial [Actinomycetota bacterium]